jgi:hypothetical protein
MHQVDDPLARERIATQAQEALDRHQPKAYRIVVNRDAIMQDDDWYQIVVTTSSGTVSSTLPCLKRRPNCRTSRGISICWFHPSTTR